MRASFVEYCTCMTSTAALVHCYEPCLELCFLSVYLESVQIWLFVHNVVYLRSTTHYLQDVILYILAIIDVQWAIYLTVFCPLVQVLLSYLMTIHVMVIGYTPSKMAKLVSYCGKNRSQKFQNKCKTLPLKLLEVTTLICRTDCWFFTPNA